MRIKILTLIAALLGTAVVFGLLANRYGAPFGKPWAVALFALVFGLVIRFEMRLEFRRDQITFSLADAVFVASLFVIGPLGIGVAVFAAECVSRSLRKVRPMKVAFNAANAAAAMTVAATGFFLLGHNNPDTAATWVAALGAAACFSVLNMVALALVLAIAEGQRFDDVFLTSAPMSILVTLAAAPLGLIGVELSRHNLLGPLLLLPLGIAVAINSRHAAAQRDEHYRFERLYEAASRTAQLVSFDDAITTAAGESKALLTAATAACFAEDRDGSWHGMVVGGDGRGRAAEPELVAALVEFAFQKPAAELALHTLPQAIRSQVPVATDVVYASSQDGAAQRVLLVAFRRGPSDDTAESRVKTLAAYANHATMAIGNARLLGEVEDALRQQVDLNRQKGDFVAAVSHELRTPLTAMLGSVGTMLRLEDRLDADGRRRMLHMAKEQGGRLKRLIEELLTVAAAEHAGMEVRTEVVDVRRLLMDVRNDLQTLTDGRVILEVSRDAHTVMSDRLKLQQILLNLVENAGKYAPEGAIEVTAAAVDGTTRIAVRDHGPGIPPGDRLRVFERFVQLDQSSTRRNGGTGLGLYLCRQLAEALGGRLVLDEAEGGGCVFTLTLPTGEIPDARPTGTHAPQSEHTTRTLERAR